MAADDDGAARFAGERDPIVSGGVRHRRQRKWRQLFAQPLTRLSPHGPPRNTLGARGRRGQRGQLAQVVDDAPGAAAQLIAAVVVHAPILCTMSAGLTWKDEEKPDLTRIALHAVAVAMLLMFAACGRMGAQDAGRLRSPSE